MKILGVFSFMAIMVLMMAQAGAAHAGIISSITGGGTSQSTILGGVKNEIGKNMPAIKQFGTDVTKPSASTQDTLTRMMKSQMGDLERLKSGVKGQAEKLVASAKNNATAYLKTNPLVSQVKGKLSKLKNLFGHQDPAAIPARPAAAAPTPAPVTRWQAIQ